MHCAGLCQQLQHTGHLCHLLSGDRRSRRNIEKKIRGRRAHQVVVVFFVVVLSSVIC